MPLTTRKMPSFEGVAPGQTATLRLPIGRTYHQLFIAYAGTTFDPSHMDGIRVVANGEVIQNLTGPLLDAMNQFDGRAAASGVLVLDFERYGLLTRAGREVTALGTGHPEDPNPITTLALEIDINSAAVAPSLSCKARQSAPSPSGLLKKIKRFNYTAAGSGPFEIADLPRGDLINRVFFGNHSVTGIKSLKLERDNFVEFERTVAENEAIQRDGVRVPQADYVVYDPTEDGYGAEGLVTEGVSDLRFTLDLTTAGAVPTIVEYIAPLEQ